MQIYVTDFRSIIRLTPKGGDPLIEAIGCSCLVTGVPRLVTFTGTLSTLSADRGLGLGDFSVSEERDPRGQLMFDGLRLSS